jgi:cytochrome oxidase Cu insertion factor (SCO1/SenC/PrrC family)
MMALAAIAGTAHPAADPTQPLSPQMQFVPPAAGSYQLQRIQRAPDALLLDAQARKRPLRDLTRGRVTLLTFFYTYCTDPLGCLYHALMTRCAIDCWRSRCSWPGAVRQHQFRSDATHRDAASALGSLRRTRLPWEFRTARSIDELLPLLDDFGQDVRVEYDPQGRPLRTINHMLKLFLIDRSGVVREIYALDYLHPDDGERHPDAFAGGAGCGGSLAPDRSSGRNEQRRRTAFCVSSAAADISSSAH